jgi:hypothetical protein
MTCKSAILAHANWKLRIHSLLSGRSIEKLDPAIVARSNECDLGRWLLSDVRNVIPRAQHAELLTVHADFHREAARIVREAYGGQDLGRKAMEQDTAFGKLTTRIVGILSKIGQPNNGPV